VDHCCCANGDTEIFNLLKALVRQRPHVIDCARKKGTMNDQLSFRDAGTKRVKDSGPRDTRSEVEIYFLAA
jgi:hypothetical protein